MSPEQVKLIRAAWPVVESDSARLAESFYAHLFEIDSSAANLFAGVDMAGQREKWRLTIAAVVHALDAPDRLLASLGAVAKRHASYGVESRHFDSVGDALLWAFADALGDEFTPELRTAWAETYSLISSVMKRAITRPTVPAV